MSIIYLLIALFLLYAFPMFRCFCLHIYASLRNGIIDLYNYFKLKKYNEIATGEIVAFVGLFGKGKTLSLVHTIVKKYHQGNGKEVWCPRRHKFVIQRVKVISNVVLSIPYENFVSMAQIVSAGELNQQYDDANDTLTVTLVLGDEFSVQLNSRQFKSNFNPLLLNTILTCRHHHISLFYSAQRFAHVDALLRQVTSYVIDCNKVWRFQGQKLFDAWDLENATNTSLIKPFKHFYWFVFNKDYDAYDTLACVGNLKKSCETGDMLSEEEILTLQCNSPVSDIVVNPSRKMKKMWKKKG